jgi:hypothetical protein
MKLKTFAIKEYANRTHQIDIQPATNEQDDM